MVPGPGRTHRFNLSQGTVAEINCPNNESAWWKDLSVKSSSPNFPMLRPSVAALRVDIQLNIVDTYEWLRAVVVRESDIL